MALGIGETLRTAREEQGRSRPDVAQSLRVRTDFVEALEEEWFDVFGADTYARGHLRNYATLLGLDPAPLLQSYDTNIRQEDRTAHEIAGAPVTITTREPMPRWVSTVGIAAAVLAAIALIGLLGNRTPDPSDSDLVAGPSSEDVVGTGDPTVSDDPSPSASPSPTPTIEGVNVTLAFEGDCWTTIEVDGTPHPESGRLFTAGDVLEVQGQDRVDLRLGSAGAVIVSVNGEVIGSPGASGEVLDVAYGPDGRIEA